MIYSSIPHLKNTFKNFNILHGKLDNSRANTEQIKSVLYTKLDELQITLGEELTRELNDRVKQSVESSVRSVLNFHINILTEQLIGKIQFDFNESKRKLVADAKSELIRMVDSIEPVPSVGQSLLL